MDSNAAVRLHDPVETCDYFLTRQCRNLHKLEMKNKGGKVAYVGKCKKRTQDMDRESEESLISTVGSRTDGISRDSSHQKLGHIPKFKFEKRSRLVTERQPEY